MPIVNQMWTVMPNYVMTIKSFGKTFIKWFSLIIKNINFFVYRKNVFKYLITYFI